MSQYWKFEDIDWSRFNSQKINPTHLALVKAGSVIEHNGSDYGRYLKNVFKGDAALEKEIDAWVLDEVKHGKVLAEWIKFADPSFDFEERFKAYITGFPINTEAEESIRGSRASELLTRCMIEIGTSTFYTVIKDGTEEPLLKQICNKIAADELRHYKLFYTHLQRYQTQEKLNFFKRFWVTFNRLNEDQDDELPFAYYVANKGTVPYTRQHYTKVYSQAVYSLYGKKHVDQGMALFCKAIGASPRGFLQKLMTFIVHNRMVSRSVKYAGELGLS
ncbi:MAG: ferritin-like domain-containing protein [Alphaproteobacteria bacterium]|nr:ferritin-like domain-containing protein [Alphaproteobacteria bacterium]